MSILYSLLFFFFSSRRRHTRLVGDWSSDVCSSDLPERTATDVRPAGRPDGSDGRSEERRVGKSVDLGGRRIIKKKKKKQTKITIEENKTTKPSTTKYNYKTKV